LLFLVLLDDLAHPALHKFLLELAHAHIGFDGSEAGITQLVMQFFDLRSQIRLRGKLFFHVGQHLQLNGALLLGRRLCHHHLRHILHHMSLHLHRQLLL
jgi:hypothetical protein